MLFDGLTLICAFVGGGLGTIVAIKYLTNRSKYKEDIKGILLPQKRTSRIIKNPDESMRT